MNQMTVFRLFSFAFLWVGMLGSTACNIVNPAESVPTYIIIDSVRLNPTLAEKHGSVSHKITDVWVY